MFNFLENSWLEAFLDWIQSLLAHQAVLGPILLLAVEESGIPLPVPGDVIIAFSGYNIARGLIPYPIALLTIMISILLGSSILYWISFRWGNFIILKFGKYLHLHPERLLTVEKHFKKYGILAIIFGRHIPGFRIPITVFAAMSGVSYKTFIFSTLISTLFWAMFYLDLGRRLGPKVRVFLKITSHWTVISLVVILLVILLFILWRKKK